MSLLSQKLLAVEGIQAQPLMLKDDNELTKVFIKQVLKKNLFQYRSYWSRLIFTGKSRPPPEKTTAEILEFVSKEIGGISIIRSGQTLPSDMKVILNFSS